MSGVFRRISVFAAAAVLGTSACTSSEETGDGDTLPKLEEFSGQDSSSLESEFDRPAQSIDAPEVLRETLPSYPWDKARALGSINELGVWVLDGQDEMCLLVARGYGQGGGFVSAQRCTSGEEFEEKGIQQASILDGSHVDIWLVPDDFRQDSEGWSRVAPNILTRP